MGDTFEVVVDIEATTDEAALLARTGLQWLVAEAVIDANPSPDCVLGAANGYRPGPHYQAAVVQPDDRIGLWQTNGLAVSTDRRVFVPIQGELGPATCPLCGYAVTLEDAATGAGTEDWELFSDALGDWHDGSAGEVRCPNCGSSITINEWHWPREWPIAVGYLGFTFWNWPRLNPTFVRRLADVVGHRLVVTRGKV